jgi:tetratricopeptide (TPR) repeat protein
MYSIVKGSFDRATSHQLSGKFVLITALIVLVLSIYVTSVSGDFVYDDQRVVLANPLLGHWDAHTLKAIFTRDYWGAYNLGEAQIIVDSSYYRPLVHIYELVAYELVGKSATGWHWLSILLHALATILVMLVLDKSLLAATDLPQKNRQLIAAFAAAIFAMHSVQSEAVAWISAFANPLGTIFSLAAFYYYLIYRNRRSYTLLALASLLLMAALLTKEIAVVVVLLVIVHELFIFNRQLALPAKLRIAAKPVIAFACVTIGYLMIRYIVLRGLSLEGQNPNFPEDASLTLMDNIRTLPALLLAYLKLAISPFGHSMLYEFNYVRSFSFTGFWLPLCFVLVVSGLLMWWGKNAPEIRIAVVWMLLPLLPHLNTRVFPSEEILHDRYLYLSMIGVALLLSVAAYKSAERLQLSNLSRLSIASAVIIVLCAATMSQNVQWQNENTLWKYASAHAPNSRVGRMALGALAESRQDYASALEEYTAALRINPNIIDALNNQAFVYAHLGRWDEATANFERIVELTPNKAVAHLNLSVAYEMQQRLDEAAREKQKAIELGLPKALEVRQPGKKEK